jgi:hypothetical protein
VPPEILSIPNLLAGIPDLMMEFKTVYYLGGPLHRTRRFIKKGDWWREETYEDRKLRRILTFDGINYYHAQPHNNYLFITDDPSAYKSTAMTISTMFNENPLYAWASILYPLPSKESFRPPAFARAQTWRDELRKHSIEPVELSPKLKRYRLTDVESQQEMVFEPNEDGVWLPAGYAAKRLIAEPGFDQTYTAKFSHWQQVQVGDSAVRLPMRVETIIILKNGNKLRGQTYEVVPGSIRAVPDTVDIHSFRVPSFNVTKPYIHSKSWPPKDGQK